MSLIQLYAETLRLGRAELPEKREAFLDIILGETQRLHGLVENVLRLARRKAPLRQDMRDLAATLQAALDEFSLPGARTLRVEIAEELPAVPHDPAAIHSLLGNLLSNALKFSGEDDAVEVRLQARKGEVVLQVRDAGPGIAAEELARICEPFYRAPQAARTRGSGLGLSIVRQIARAHHARLHIDSQPGVGTTVEVVFRAD